MTKKIGFALIGCGRVSSRHAEALQISPFAKLVAVCDLVEQRARDRAQGYGVPYYQDYHQMLQENPDIEVVSIITPSGIHFEHASDIISRYNKHVVIEKPMVMTPQQGKDLIALARRHEVQIFPVFQNRFNRAVKKVKAEIQPEGSLGPLRVGTVRMRWCRPQRYYDLGEWRGKWAMDGGALTNQGIHYIDLLRYLCGEVKRVCAAKATLGAKIEVEDTAVAVLEFQSGALGVIEVMTSARPDDFEASISCVCEKGLAVIGGIATNELVTFSPQPSATAENSEKFPTVYGFGHNEVINRVAQSLLGEKSDPVAVEDGLETIRLLHAIYRSTEIGTWVELEQNPESRLLGRKDEALLQPYRTPYRERSPQATFSPVQEASP